MPLLSDIALSLDSPLHSLTSPRQPVVFFLFILPLLWFNFQMPLCPMLRLPSCFNAAAPLVRLPRPTRLSFMIVACPSHIVSLYTPHSTVYIPKKLYLINTDQVPTFPLFLTWPLLISIRIGTSSPLSRLPTCRENNRIKNILHEYF